MIARYLFNIKIYSGSLFDQLKNLMSFLSRLTVYHYAGVGMGFNMLNYARRGWEGNTEFFETLDPLAEVIGWCVFWPMGVAYHGGRLLNGKPGAK